MSTEAIAPPFSFSQPQLKAPVKKVLLALTLSLFATMSFAAASDQGCTSSGNTPASCGGSSSNVDNSFYAKNSSRNTNRNTNVNTQGQAQGQGQTQAATATGGVSNSSSTSNATGGTSLASTGASTSSASNQGVSVNNSTTSTTTAPDTIKTVGQAPDVLTTPTAPCRISVGASAGWLGGAFGIGTSVEDQGCTMRENARLLFNFGEKAAALKLMCTDPKVAAVLAVCEK